MSHRHLTSTNALAAAIAPVIIMALLLQVPAAGQSSPAAAKAKASAKTWTPPRTPDGQPDLQGFWNNSTLTPLERPKELAGKQVLTEEEAAEYQKRLLEEADAPNPQANGLPLGLQVGRSLGASWFERGKL